MQRWRLLLLLLSCHQRAPSDLLCHSPCVGDLCGPSCTQLPFEEGAEWFCSLRHFPLPGFLLFVSRLKKRFLLCLCRHLLPLPAFLHSQNKPHVSFCSHTCPRLLPPPLPCLASWCCCQLAVASSMVQLGKRCEGQPPLPPGPCPVMRMVSQALGVVFGWQAHEGALCLFCPILAPRTPTALCPEVLIWGGLG